MPKSDLKASSGAWGSVFVSLSDKIVTFDLISGGFGHCPEHLFLCLSQGWRAADEQRNPVALRTCPPPTEGLQGVLWIQITHC